LYERYDVFGVKLCGNPCLVMPYGIEISSHEHLELADKITDLLTEFAKKGFTYEEELQWRHVLRDYANNLFLVDLESLTLHANKCFDKNPNQNFNEEQITKQWVKLVVKKEVDELLKKSVTATPSPVDAAADAIPGVEVAPVASKRKRE
jgi:hypothetical protein